MRRLSPEEAALWRRVTGGVRALNPPDIEAIVASPSRRRGSVGEPGAILPSRPLLARGPREPSNNLDASWDKRIAAGRIDPDFTIDLHGETLASAHAKLNHRLGGAIRSGARVVLLITGRPARDNPRMPPTSRGVIRASVQDWLAASSHSAQIAAIRNAHQRHGGAGALYLILRRAR